MNESTQIILIFCVTIVSIVAISKDYNLSKKSINKDNNSVVDEISITKNEKE